MFKRILSIILVIVMVVTIVSATTLAADISPTTGDCGDNVTYSYDETTKTLTISGSGDMWDYWWGEAPFYDVRANITSVIIEGGVTSIGNSTFKSFNNLTNVEISAELIRIGTDAFSSCTSLEAIELPSSVTTIESSAFGYCSALTSFTIPASTLNLGSLLFLSCGKLASITVDENNRHFCAEDGVLFDKDKTTLIVYPQAKGDTTYTVPNSVQSIADSGFRECTNLLGVDLSDATESIGSGAFYYCENLQSIILPESLTRIEWNAFVGCSALSDAYYGGTSPDWDGITIDYDGDGNYILDDATFHYEIQNGGYCGDNAIYSYDDTAKILNIYGSGDMYDYYQYETSPFYNSYAEQILIQDGITSIGVLAFENCSYLKSIDMGGSVEFIKDSAFHNCVNLDAIQIPASVTDIHCLAFSYCDQLAQIEVDIENDYYSSLDGVLYNYDQTKLCLYPTGRSATYYNIPDSVCMLGDYAFGLETQTALGEYNHLTSLTFPLSLTEIGWRAVWNCGNVTDIYYMGTQAQWNAISIDSEDDSDWFPIEIVHFNDTSSPGSCGNDVTYTYDDTTKILTISGTGAMWDYTWDTTPFNGSDVETITIESGVTHIGNYTFFCCEDVTSVYIANSVTSIATDAFDSASALLTIRGYAGSYAQTYATAQGIAFVSVYDTTGAATATTYGAAYSILVVGSQGEPLENATVSSWYYRYGEEIEATQTTDEFGIAVFPVTDTEYWAHYVYFDVSYEGYWTVEGYGKTMMLGSQTTLVMEAWDGTPKVTKLVANSSKDTTNLLTTPLYVNIYTEEVETTFASLAIHATAQSEYDIAFYQLLIEGQVIATSTDGTFYLDGGITDQSSKWGTDQLAINHVLYLRVVDANGGETTQMLPIYPWPYMPDPQGDEDDFQLVNASPTEVADSIPIWGGAELKFGMVDSVVPKLKVFADGTVKFSINLNAVSNNTDADEATGKEAWANAKKEFTETLALLRNQDYASIQQATKEMNAGAFKVDLNLIAYGEGKLNEDGSLDMTVTLVIQGKQEAGHTWPIVVFTVPAYIELREEFKFDAELATQLKLGSAADTISQLIFDKIQMELAIFLGGGVGVNNVLSLGVEGKGAGVVEFNMAEDYELLTFESAVYIVAKMMTFEHKIEFFPYTYTLYDSRSRTISALPELNVTYNLYDTSQYTMMSRDYLEPQEMATYGVMSIDAEGESVIAANGFPNPMAKMVQVGDITYAFWLADAGETRTDENRTALVYATSTDMSNWSEPVQVIPEVDASTADYDFQLTQVDGTVHIILSKVSKVLDSSDDILTDTVTHCEMFYATLDTDTLVTTNQRITTNAYFELLPAISADGTTVAWLENRLDGADGFLQSGNTQNIVYGTIGDWENLKTIAIDATENITALQVGTLNDERYIAYASGGSNVYTAGTTTLESTTEIHLISLDTGDKIQLTNNELPDSDPQFATINGNAALVWYANGDLNYTTDGTTISQIVATGVGSKFLVLDDQIIWEASSAEDDTTTFYGVSCEEGQWGATYVLGTTENQYPSQLSGYTQGDNTYVCFVQTMDDDVSVKTKCLTPTTNVSLTNVYLVDETALTQSGQDVELSLTVANLGSQTVETLEVFVDGQAEATIADTHLMAGETEVYQVTVDFTVGDGVTTHAIKITASEESDLTDNQIDLSIGYADIQVFASHQWLQGVDLAEFVVQNKNSLETNVTLEIYSDYQRTALLTTVDLGTIEAKGGLYAQVPLGDWLDQGYTGFYFTVVSSREEALLTDNTGLLSTPIQLQAYVPGVSVSIEQATYANETLSVEAIYANLTESATAYLAVYQGEKMVKAFIKTLTPDNTEIVLGGAWSDYNGGDYTLKLMTLDETLAPLCTAVSVDLE